MQVQTPLPQHLVSAWGNSTKDPRDSKNFCAKQSHKTPMIPWHNGYPKCLACGQICPSKKGEQG